MCAARQLVAQVSPYNTPVLFLGESGVGKTYYSRLLHDLSNWAEGPFIELNCATTPDTLLELELFGASAAGEYPSALRGKLGAWSLAESGTLLLKEIHAMPLRTQSRLAGLLSNRCGDSAAEKPASAVQPDAGGERLKKVIGTKRSGHGGSPDKPASGQPRVVATTDADLYAMVAAGDFREELYYALNAVPVEIPPLRERPEDTLRFILHYLKVKNAEYGFNKRLTQQAMDTLLAYAWPGNIREIYSVMERLLLTSPEALIRNERLLRQILDSCGSLATLDAYEGGRSLKEMLEFHERRIILDAFATHKTTVAMARALGISQPSAARKLAKYRTGGVNDPTT